jgi:TolB-like protein/DNA-binding winged helix-turn-helix (wHTH) protein
MARILRFDDVEIDTAAFRLSKAGTPLQVEPKTLRLLIYLAENSGRLVERRELIAAVWGDAFVTDHVLNRAVGQLRKALADDPKESRYIETAPTLGYRFIAKVETLGAAKASPAPADAPEAAGGTAASDSNRPRIPRTAAAIGAALLIALVAIGFWKFVARQAIPSPVRALAVLPLRNLSGDPAQDYVADGVTEELITELGQIGSLRVVSPVTAMQYKNSTKRLPQIANELGVDVVVTGAVVHAGDRLRIDAQLMDARADRQIWAHSYEGDLSDTFGLQRQVAKSVATALKARLSDPDREAGTKPVNREAYEALLEGDYVEENTPASELKALAYYQKSAAIDPSFARAYVGIARAYDFLSNYGTVPAGEAGAAADAANAKAIALDPSLAEAFAERGWTDWTLHWELINAENDFRHALELDPNLATAHIGLAHVLVATGRFDSGREEADRARDLDPASPLAETNACFLLRMIRHNDEAFTRCRQALDLNPAYNWANYNIAEIYAAQGRLNQAHDAVSRGLWWFFVCNSPLCFDMFDEVHGVRSKAGAFEAWLRRNSPLPADGDVFLMYAYAGLGRKDEAFASMQKAYEQREGMDLMLFLGVDPQFDSLHSDQRFNAFLKKAGLPLPPNGN